MKQKGQIILILILIMTVALGIGLSIVQKSLVDLSTASKVDQSSRAFSAAEAGVEKALKESTTTTHTGPSFTDTSSGVKEINDTGLIPCVPGVGVCPPGQQTALEYPPLAKEDVVQVWLADLNSSSNPPTPFYVQNSLDVYWGSSPTDMPALELTLVYYDGAAYNSIKRYLDGSASRYSQNGFQLATLCSGGNTPFGGVSAYQCRYTIGGPQDPKGHLPTSPSSLMLLRARLLYNATSQPFAVQAVGTCNPGCSLPPQARSIESTGVAGETQRKVRVFQENKVVPPFFDYAIFSAGQISKN